MNCERENESLRDEVAALRTQVRLIGLGEALTRAELTELQGTPQDWPQPVPAALRPDAFRAEMARAVAAEDGLTIKEIDCSDYPCVALLRVSGVEPSVDPDSWIEQPKEIVRGISIQAFGLGEVTTVAVSRIVTEPSEPLAAFVAVATVPSGDEEILRRTRYRAAELTRAPSMASAR